MKKYPTTIFYIGLILILLISGCATIYPRVDGHGMPQFTYNYRVPEVTGDGWETSSLNAEGVEQEKIEELIQNILNRKFKNIQSVLIVKNGKLVLEEYFYGFNRDKMHQLRSATKSVTSILVGIAKDQKLISSVDQKLYEIFPEYEEIDWSSPKDKITIKHVLTMSAGLEWNEWAYADSDSRSSIYGMVRSNDWIRFVLGRRAIQPPGEIFNYSSGLSLVLGEIIKKKTGFYANEYARKYLFGPLGISEYSWQNGPGGMVYTSGGEKGLYLRPRDMAKIGFLYINKGNWKDQQIVSAEWVKESTQPHVKAFFAGSEYGYQWWRGEKGIEDDKIRLYYAVGHGGQYIFVCPSLDLVAVFTSKVSGNPLGVARPQVAMLDYIIPSIISLPPSKINNVLASTMRSDFIGTYECKNLRVKLKIFEEGNDLYCKVFRERTKMFYKSDNQFIGNLDKIGDVQFKFFRDEDEDIDNVLIKIGFSILQFKKMV